MPGYDLTRAYYAYNFENLMQATLKNTVITKMHGIIYILVDTLTNQKHHFSIYETTTACK